jgi:hypothetical protein
MMTTRIDRAVWLSWRFFPANVCEDERDVIVRWNSEEIFEVKPYQASLLPNSLIGRFLTTCVDLVLTPTM